MRLQYYHHLQEDNMEHKKYIRQISLPQVGISGQQKLNNAKVLVIGAGGLANAMVSYLASSGIGTIGIIDGDTVSISNLHRQVLFSENDINRFKAEVIAEKINAQFPEVIVTLFNEFLSSKNALSLFEVYDIIVDATDSIAIRYVINDACILTKKPFVHASIYRFQYQVATFNLKQSGSYRCLYPNPPKQVQNCAEAGVMPTTVAMAGLHQANEVLKLILNIGEPLTNTLLLVDTLRNKQHKFEYKTKAHKYITTAFFKNTYQDETIKTISFKTASERDGIFLDVRQFDEHPKLSFENYIQIPIEDLNKRFDQISKSKPIYMFCQSGKRSKNAYIELQKKQFQHLYCLKENAIEMKTLTQKFVHK